MARRKVKSVPTKRKQQNTIWFAFRPFLKFFIGFICIGGFWIICSQTAFGTRLGVLLDQNLASSGITAQHINITGVHNVSQQEILDKIQVTPDRSLFFYDLAQIKADIETIQAVKLAKIQRQLPNTLSITILERMPVALLQSIDKPDVLIDADGIALPDIKIDKQTKYLSITGAGAGPKAQNLIAVLANYPSLAIRIMRAVRISDRRWDLNLDKNITIRLPEDEQIDAALKTAVPMLNQAKPDKVIDLRLMERPAIL